MWISVPTYWVQQIQRGQVLTANDRVQSLVGMEYTPLGQDCSTGDAYRGLEAEVGPCGIAEIGGASVAAPYVSTLVASGSISRVIAVTSSFECRTKEVGGLSLIADRKLAQLTAVDCRGIGHAGKPALRGCR